MAVELPKTLAAYMNIRKKHEDVVSFNYPPHVRQICKYSGAALMANRSCGNVMIMMAGQSGAGKSTTINKLFNDDELCSTSVNSSDTPSVIEVEAQLLVKNQEPPLKSSLLFIDIPGALDNDAEKREPNQAIIEKYLKTSPFLSPRPSRILDTLGGRAGQKMKRSSFGLVWENKDGGWKSFQKVYPNLILFTTNANDKRMLGENSNLCETLKLLAKLGIVDDQNPNLLVVVTNAASLARRADKYIERVKQITHDINELIKKVFAMKSLNEVKVVFIENDPEGQELEQVGEFYKLPDGSISHLNLIQSISEIFNANRDFLGNLLCGWYFGRKCTVRAIPHERMTLAHLGMSDEEIAEAYAREIEEMNVRLVNELPLEYISHGYCPSMESVRSRTILATGSSTQSLNIKVNCYSTHSEFICNKIEESEFVRCTQETKEKYQSKRQKDYGLDSDSNFILSDAISADGKWEVGDQVNTTTTVQFLYEVKLLYVHIKNPPQICTDLRGALNNLPMEFNGEKAQQFESFFNEWGTHFVKKSTIGGSIKLVCHTQISDLPQFDSDFEKYIKSQFDILNEPIISKRIFVTDLDKRISDFNLEICGGKVPPISKFSQLTPKIFHDWLQSIEEHPTELESTIKLQPYYSLIPDEPQRASFKKATLNYLQMTKFADKPLTRENVTDYICSHAAHSSLLGFFRKMKHLASL